MKRAVCRYIFHDFFIIKPTRRTNFSDLFLNDTLHVSDSYSVHHQELFTVLSVMVYVIQVGRQLSSRIRMELQFQNKSEKLVRLVGFIVKKLIRCI
jgi:hypothetical protein